MKKENKKLRPSLILERKRAVFFSIDALMALIIILVVVLIAFPVLRESRQTTEIHFDVLSSLSSIEMEEFQAQLDPIGQNADHDAIRLQMDPENTILEQIGAFYVANRPLAIELANVSLVELDTNENIGIWYENTLVFSTGDVPFQDAETVDTARQIISGISEAGEGSVTGFAARAFLESTSKDEFFYFGGYVGDGNISAPLNYEGDISSAKMELAIDKNFDLFINGNPAGTNYASSPDEFTPVSYTINETYLPLFTPGSNTIELRGDDLHIAGGFFRINYNSNVTFQRATAYDFPGIEGFVNLYDGFYIPGILTALNLSLHVDIETTPFFLNIGNTTVYNGSTAEGGETIFIDNSELSTKLDYTELSQKTTPLRLGLENVSFAANTTADVFSVTDLSGSMAQGCSGGSFWCCVFSGDFCTSEATCTSCGGTFEDPIGNAQEANKVFIDGILGTEDNRVGLAGYKGTASNNDYHALSEDATSLKSEVDSWTASGSTCICCGINKAVNDLITDSDPEKARATVVMSDGEANRGCEEQPGNDPKQDAIQAACDAYDDHNITTHTVAFGSDADVTTLQSIAACGNGAFYFSELEDIIALYEQIAQDIIELTYLEQTIEVSGDLYTRLYPDSTIGFTYSQAPPPFGLITTAEKQFDNSSTGIFSIPENATVLEARSTSYSGPRWTSVANLKNEAENTIYNISEVGSNFIAIGDPFSVDIPSHLITNGTNQVTVSTGVFPGDDAEGSASNKIIYTILQNASSFSSIAPSAVGCEWKIEFEDDSIITVDIPNDYEGEDVCTYTSADQADINENDAFQLAVLGLLQQLDFDSDFKVDVIFSEQDLSISSSEITGIPFSWSTEVQVRIWRG